MPLRITIAAGIITGFFILPASAQFKLEEPVRTKEHGVLSNNVRNVRKSKDGFMWMGTSEGLCRFDGQQVKTYKQGPDLSKSPFDNLVMSVLPVDNEIWMGTAQGISVMSRHNETFRHYQLTDKGKDDTIYRRFDQSINVLYQDRQGDIWIGSRDRGAWLYNKEKDELINFPYPEESYPRMVPALGSNITVLSIEASRTNDSVIWVGTAAGLQRINKISGQVTWYTFPQKDKQFQVNLNAFRRMHSSQNGLLYVGSWEAGVNVFNPEKGTFLPLVLKDGKGKDMLASPISSIIRKDEGELWITSIQGLVVYDINKERVTWYKKNKQLESTFYGIDYIDEAGRIWLVTINGLQYFDPVGQQFATHSFEHLYNRDWAYAFYIQSDAAGEKVTVCPRAADGLYEFEKRTGEWKRFPFRSKKETGSDFISVRGFAPITENEYLVVSDQGLFTYSKKTQQLQKPARSPSIKFNRWGETIRDSKGNYWISADADGLVKWNMKTGQHRIFKKELQLGVEYEGFGRANVFLEDSHSNIWISRPWGFSVYLAREDSIVNFLYNKDPSNSFPMVHGFAEDRHGRVWVSSNDGWYGYIDSKTPLKGLRQKFDLKQYGINDGISQLATDKEGNVWGYTEKLLIRLSDEVNQWQTFDFAYGVKVVDFFHFSFLPSGELVFGGRNSITMANPSSFQRNKEVPEPYITGMQVLNQPVPVDFFAGPDVRLGAKQNFFSVSFSAKAYTMPQEVKFRYRLRGFDDWTETRERRFVNYTNVPPGNYVFELQVANNEGVWNKRTLELPVQIATPLLQTWGFRIGALLAIIALGYWWYRYRIHQVRKKEKLKSQYEKKLANVEMTALLAQMNPHFLFNSLNSIDSYIIRNESGKASEYLNNFARLMRLILQNSRSNYISLKDELEALDLYLQMEELRFKDKFQYEIKIDKDLDLASIVIPPMLIQPYVENAVWHGLMHKKDGKTGKVEINISQQDNNLVCVIQDNGIGRERAQELKAQKTGGRKRSMGMQITKDRIEMINKLYNTTNSVQIIDLKDEEGKANGTKVELIVPV